MEDLGDCLGWPHEGFCLVVGSRGEASAGARARPAWLVKQSTNRPRVLVYGEGRGCARELHALESVEALPSDEALAVRLQKDWASAPPSARDAALRGLDEMEARRAAPWRFIEMITTLRNEAVAGKTADILGPSASIGREFYPNLFAPFVGDSARVLYDRQVWYEAIIVQKVATDTREGEPIAKRAQSGAVVACDSYYFADAGTSNLQVRYLSDGERESLAWPDPKDEAFLIAQPPKPKKGSAAFLTKENQSVLDAPRRRSSPRSNQSNNLNLPRDWRPFLAKDRNGLWEAEAAQVNFFFSTNIDLDRGSQTSGRTRNNNNDDVAAQEEQLIPEEADDVDMESPEEEEEAAAAPEEEHEEYEEEVFDEANWKPMRTLENANRAYSEATAHYFSQEKQPSDDDDDQQAETNLEEKEREERRRQRRELGLLGPTAIASVRCCLWLKAIARPLSALIDDFGQLKESLEVLAFDDTRGNINDDDWPFERPPALVSPVAALSELADALSRVLPVSALPKSFQGGGARQKKTPWLRRGDARAADAHLALAESRVDFSLFEAAAEEISSPETQQEESTTESLVAQLREAAAVVADGWDASRRSQTLGPGDDVFAAGAPCFATLPRSKVKEPHRSWIRRARIVAKDTLETKQQKDFESFSEDSNEKGEEEDKVDTNDDDDSAIEDIFTNAPAPKRRKKIIQQNVARRYRPPGAAARKIMCGGDELAMGEQVPTEITASLASGLGGDCGPRVEVVTIASGDMRGEKGVVARRDLERRSCIPYAGVVVTDDELAKLLWRQPRAVANWLMYRYEFAPMISVLPYLSCPSFAPAPFINCARGPHATDLFVWQSFNASTCVKSESSALKKKKKSRMRNKKVIDDKEDSSDSSDSFSEDSDDEMAIMKAPYYQDDDLLAGLFEDEPEKPRWRAWGSQHIGLRVRRSLFASPRKASASSSSPKDDQSSSLSVDGTVVAWLDKDESEFFDEKGAPAALYRVKYDEGSVLAGDVEDLELFELLASSKAPSKDAPGGGFRKKGVSYSFKKKEALAVVSSSSDESNGDNLTKEQQLAVKPNCHFEEVLVDGAVLGVYVVASRKISAGEPLLVTYGREFWSGWVQRRARLADLDYCADGLATAAKALVDALREPSAVAKILASKKSIESEEAMEPKMSRHDRWRRVVGVPFETQRALRGERGRPAVVVGLAVEAPNSADTWPVDTTNSKVGRELLSRVSQSPTSLALRGNGHFALGDRVEGYWRGAAPSFPATVIQADDAQLRIAYDDGHEEVTSRGFVRPLLSPQGWRDLVHVPVGAWVRKFDNDLPTTTTTTNKKTTSAAAAAQKNKRRREGVVVAVRSNGHSHRLDVLGDDNVLDADQPADDWEPLFVTRFADDNEQRVMGIDQLAHLQPLFIDATRRRTLFPTSADADNTTRRYLAAKHENNNSERRALQPRVRRILILSFILIIGRRRESPRACRCPAQAHPRASSEKKQ